MSKHVLMHSHYRYNSVDINVAVATDAGLITPIVFRADNKVSFFLKVRSHRVISDWTRASCQLLAKEC